MKLKGPPLNSFSFEAGGKMYHADQGELDIPDAHVTMIPDQLWGYGWVRDVPVAIKPSPKPLEDK